MGVGCKKGSQQGRLHDPLGVIQVRYTLGCSRLNSGGELRYAFGQQEQGIRRGAACLEAVKEVLSTTSFFSKICIALPH